MGLLKKDFKNLFSNKIWLCLWLGAIVLSAVLLSSNYETKSTDDSGKLKIGLINSDKENIYSRILVNFFKNNENFSKLISVTEGEEEYIEEAFYNGELAAYIVIPENFFGNVIYGESSNIKAVINQKHSNTSIILLNMLSGYEDYVEAVQYTSTALYLKKMDFGIPVQQLNEEDWEFSIELIKKALQKDMFFEYEVIENSSSVELTQHYIIVAVLIFVMYMSVFIGIDMIKERELGIIKRYKSTNSHIIKFLMSKVFVNCIMISLLLIVPYIAGCLVKSIGINYMLILMFVFVTMFFVIISLCISLISDSKYTYVLTVNMIWILLIIVSGAVIPYGYMPDNMQTIADYSPLYRMITGIYDLF